MEIHFNPNIKPTSISKKRSKESSGGFKAQVGQSASTTDTTSVVNVQNVNMAEAVFSVQEISGEQQQKAQVKERGSKMLAHLDQIHLALLTGSLDITQLADLEKMIAEQLSAEIEDPRLHEILRDIEVRAAVEMAKLQRG